MIPPLLFQHEYDALLNSLRRDDHTDGNPAA